MMQDIFFILDVFRAIFDVVQEAKEERDKDYEARDHSDLPHYSIDLDIQVAEEVADSDQKSGPHELSDKIEAKVMEKGDPGHSRSDEGDERESETVCDF